jgi:CMP-N-acetylneuraminic acid synthetase
MISFFLPIKKNSKRVKNKNTRKINNFQFGLTEIKISQLKKFRNFAKKDSILKKEKFEYIISSDNKQIAKYLKKFPWIKFYSRPKKLAQDDCLEDLIKYVPKVCAGDLILWTHTTSPLFNHLCYLRFVKNFLKNIKKYDSSFTASKIQSFIFNATKKKWLSHNRKINKWPRTQDLDKIYSINNAAFISKRNVYLNQKDRIGNNPLPFSEVVEENEIFDIDNKADFNYFKKNLLIKV